MAANAGPASFLSALDQIRAVALEGLKYCQNPYDVARYTKLLDVAATGYSEILQIDKLDMLERLRSQIGIVTPKLGADAAVLNDRRQMLILKRADDKRWCLPGGWIDVDESPAEAAVREVREEAGLDVRPIGYIAITCKGPHRDARLQHQVNVVTLMETVSSSVEVTLSHEHTDYRWVDKTHNDVAWHVGHEVQAQRVFEYLDAGMTGALAI